jgi:hypothetical protein
MGRAERPPGIKSPDPPGPQPSDQAILVSLIKFATFVSVFASINVKVEKLTAIVAKKNAIVAKTNFAGEIVATIFCYCSKTSNQ